jgi:AcrR family transcriptional regulator
MDASIGPGYPELVNANGTPAPRPLRRDAERNRQRILVAARTLFAEQGLGVSHDQLAEAADVAVGTVYRRFPDKESLIEALFAEEVDALLALADAALRIADPWEALVSFMTRSLETQAGNRSLKELALGGAPGLALVCQAQERLTPIIDELVARAQAAGRLRPGIGTEDFALVPIMIGAIIDSARDVDPDLWRRTLTLVLDGFRAQHCGALPCTSPSPDQMARIKNGWRPPGAARPQFTRVPNVTAR